MKVLIAFILMLGPVAFAKSSRGPKGIVLSVGPSAVTGYDSVKEAPNGKKLMSADGSLGYNLGVEVPILGKFLTFNLNVAYSRRDAKTQYFDRTNSVQADDQKSLISNSDALVGLRVRPLSLGFFRIFIGGGGVFGNAKLRHDKDDYIERHGPVPSGFKEVEKVNKWGNYLEAGTEIVFNKNNALRFMGQMVNSQTERFQTLNKKDIKGTYSMFTIQYSYFAEFIK